MGARVIGLDLSKCKTLLTVRPWCWLGCSRGHTKLPRRLTGLEVRMEMVSHFAGDERVTLGG